VRQLTPGLNHHAPPLTDTMMTLAQIFSKKVRPLELKIKIASPGTPSTPNL